MHDPDRLLLMGTVGRPHGVTGSVKVAPETDDPDRFRRLPRVFVGSAPETARPLDVSSVRFQHPKGRTVVLLTLDGIAGRDAAEALRGQRVFALDADLPALGAGEVFLHDLVGFTVHEADDDGRPTGRTLGTVRDLFDGAQLLFGIDAEGAAPGAPLVLLPDVDEFVLDTDVPGRRLLVRPPEGLFGDAESERDVPDDPDAQAADESAAADSAAADSAADGAPDDA